MRVTPHRNIIQRAANRLLQPLGIKLFPVAFECDLPEAGAGSETVFNAIYAQSYWGDSESKSGSGSELASTAHYREQFVAAIEHFGFKSIFDAPCGDLNWMPEVLKKVDITYIGGDIAEEALVSSRQRRPDLEFRKFDICLDDFPDVDFWHCRDTFFHLSFHDIERAIENSLSSNIEYVGFTTHRARYLRNIDIKTGGFRLLDLERAPFCFPKALTYLEDYPAGQFRKYVGIWRMSDIRAARAAANR